MRYLVTAVLGLALMAGAANAAEKEWGTRPQPYKATFDVTEHFVKNVSNGELVVYEDGYDPKSNPVTLTVSSANTLSLSYVFLSVAKFEHPHDTNAMYRSNQMQNAKPYHAKVSKVIEETGPNYDRHSSICDITFTESSLLDDVLSAKKVGFIIDGREYLFDMDYPAVDQAKNFFHQ